MRYAAQPSFIAVAQDDNSELGGYVLGELLAKGGMAEVYTARSVRRSFERPIIAKRMLPELAREPSFVDLFVEEARISTRLTHPNIVQVYDFEATDKGLYLIMELIDGPDLLAVLAACAKQRLVMEPSLAAYIACHVLEALDYAHGDVAKDGRAKVVHRDVSPGNVLISRRGEVKLADFGIARSRSAPKVAETGVLRGKFGYMSPEQISGGVVDWRSDLFSVGVVLSEMLMGRRLFAAAEDLDVLVMIRSGDLSRLEKYGAHIPQLLRDLVSKALSLAKTDRFDSAAQFRDALTDWLATTPTRGGGAARLANLIARLEPEGRRLSKLIARSGSSDMHSLTLSGQETRNAQIERSRAVMNAKRAFETGPTLRAMSAAVAEITLDEPPLSAEGSIPPGSVWTGEVTLDQGSLADVSGLDLYCEIVRRRLTGRLQLERVADTTAARAHRETKDAYFVDGNPEFVLSNLPDERFGQFLVNRGALTAEQLHRVLAVLPQYGNRIGSALVHLGLLTPVDAVRYLEKQLCYRLSRACSWRHGDYRFELGTRNQQPAVKLPIRTLEILGSASASVPTPIGERWRQRFARSQPVVNIDLLRQFGCEERVREQLRGWCGAVSVSETTAGLASAAERAQLLGAAYTLWRCGGIETGDAADTRNPPRGFPS